MSERKLTGEALDTMREMLRRHGLAEYFDALVAREQLLGQFIRQVASLDPSLGPMDIHTLVADARQALAAVPVGTQEAAACTCTVESVYLDGMTREQAFREPDCPVHGETQEAAEQTEATS